MKDFLANCIHTNEILLVEMYTALMYPIYIYIYIYNYIKNALATPMPFTYYYTAYAYIITMYFTSHADNIKYMVTEVF